MTNWLCQSHGAFMAKIYHDSDADLGVLKGKKIAVLGFGSQGRGSVHVPAGQRAQRGRRCPQGPGASWKKAKADGMKVAEITDAVKGADVVMFLLPDEVQATGSSRKRSPPNLKEGAALDFAHGFSITFGIIKPPKNVDVIMMAPKAPGPREREVFLEGFGVPALIAVEQDFTGNAKKIALALAKGLGSTKAGVIETNFKEEATSDLFGEQAVLCGGVTALIEAGFNTLVKRGYQPEIAYFECLHELKLIVDLIQAGGMMKMWTSVSNTAEYGGLAKGNLVINETSKAAMEKMLDDIIEGKFAKEWMKDANGGMKKLQSMETKVAESNIEVVGKEIRALFEAKPVAKAAAKKPAVKKAAVKPRREEGPGQGRRQDRRQGPGQEDRAQEEVSG